MLTTWSGSCMSGYSLVEVAARAGHPLRGGELMKSSRPDRPGVVAPLYAARTKKSTSARREFPINCCEHLGESRRTHCRRRLRPSGVESPRRARGCGLKFIGSLDSRYSDVKPPKVATLFAPKQRHTSPGQRPGLRWEISLLSPERAAQAADATCCPALSGRSDSMVSATQGVALG